MELSIAQEIGKEFLKVLEPICEKIQLAGSIRRKKSLVKDIEIVCEITTDSKHKLKEILNKLVVENRIKLIKNGERYKQISLLEKREIEIIKVDLFIVLPPAQWGVIFLLRTGSGTFSKRFVTEIKTKFRISKGHLEKLKTITDALGTRDIYVSIKTPTEKSVFKAVGRDYIPPEGRME